MENKKELNKMIIPFIVIVVIGIIGAIVYKKMNSNEQEKVFYIADGIKVSAQNMSLNKGENKKFTITVNGAAGIIELDASNSLVNVSTKNADCNETKCFYDALTKDASVEYVVTGVETGNSQININLADMLTINDEPVTGTGTINVSVK